MSDRSAIEWTDSTWQPVSGCSRKSPGCENCYAELLAGTRLRHQARYEGLTRMTSHGPRWTGKTRFNEGELLKPLSWKKPRRVFVCSMADLFHESVPFEWIDKVFAVMALCPQHTFQVLTKRPERMVEFLHWIVPGRSDRVDRIGCAMNRLQGRDIDRPVAVFLPLPNVWLGTSVENQAAADERIPHLLSCPAAVRFLSCEPLLGPVDLFDVSVVGDCLDWDRYNHCKCGDGECSECWQSPSAPVVNWVIVGGESGKSARPCTIGHIRSIVKQCKTAEVPCFVKQLGSYPVNREGERHPVKDHHNIDEFPEDLRVREYPA